MLLNLSDDSYRELYSSFLLDRVKIISLSGEQRENTLLNPFAFFSKLIIPDDAYKSTMPIPKDLEESIAKRIDTFRNLHYGEIEVLSPVEVSIQDNLGYVIEGKPFKLIIDERNRIPIGTVQLRDTERFMELLLFILWANLLFIKENKNQSVSRRHLLINVSWEISSYLFAEIYYKDAAVDPLYKKSFITKKLQRVIMLLFSVYTATPKKGYTILEEFGASLSIVFGRAVNPPKYFDITEDQFIIEELIQPYGSPKPSIFSLVNTTTDIEKF